jgi:hypothetical protein
MFGRTARNEAEPAAEERAYEQDHVAMWGRASKRTIAASCGTSETRGGGYSMQSDSSDMQGGHNI